MSCSITFASIKCFQQVEMVTC